MDIIELFAGVGGFRIGFENNNKIKDENYKIVWSNQWEPSKKKQHASDIYIKNFGNECHINDDIAKVNAKDIPKHDLLCGGFPCQDYSVMRPKNKSKGLEGKKGVLWWEINRIIKEHQTKFLLLENVDRLILSPGHQKGRDFAIILKSLMNLDYIVEWRVINAAEYGFPQKRRRTFIFAYKKDSIVSENIFNKNNHNLNNLKKENITSVFNDDGIFAKTFDINKIEVDLIKEIDLSNDIFDISDNFNKNNKEYSSSSNNKPFFNTGIAINDKVYTLQTIPKYDGKMQTIKDILLDEKEIPEEFFVLDKEKIKKWENAKDRIHKERINKITGETYIFKGGKMPYPDSINSPARTIITSEGGSSASRTSHIIKPNDKLRKFHSIELERLNGFPDNHTEGLSPSQRGFLMGNALIVGIVERLANTLKELTKE
jgi:DNA (cytosine-5)-methyltransferase 1